MIRTVVTLLSSLKKVRTITAAEIVENRYPNLLASQVRRHHALEQQKIIDQQILNARLAQATPFQRARIELRQEYYRQGSKLSQNQYQDRLEQIERQEQQHELARKGLL